MSASSSGSGDQDHPLPASTSASTDFVPAKPPQVVLYNYPLLMYCWLAMYLASMVLISVRVLVS